MTEFEYVFVDVTGHCFESFQAGGENENERNYRSVIGAWLRGGKRFIVGDMMCFKQDLLDAGFEWGKDFYVKKEVKK